jgi:hypothetical protein
MFDLIILKDFYDEIIRFRKYQNSNAKWMAIDLCHLVFYISLKKIYLY